MLLRKLSTLIVPLALWAVLTGRANAQDLPLRTDPGEEGASALCTESETVEPPSAEEQTQAAELVSEANESVILGELDRAEGLLRRATELDPSSADLAYRYARVLEDMGRVAEAMRAYCRVRSLAGPGGIADATARLDSLVAAERRRVPEAARDASRLALEAARRGDLRAALGEFDRATTIAPTWADAAYNRGVVLARLGRDDEAVEALRRYLELVPDAPDAPAVARRIGQLEVVARTRAEKPSPGAAVTLGALFPGMGQLYSGRAKAGLLVASLAGGTVAAGLLVTRVDVRCQQDVPPGQPCPVGAVVSRSTVRPHLTQAIGIATAITLFGAIEAFLHARQDRNRPATFDGEGLQLEGPSMEVHTGRLDLNFVRVLLPSRP